MTTCRRVTFVLEYRYFDGVPGGLCLVVFFFFFSSRRRHTRFKCDWSSDVCSSDLVPFDATLNLFLFPSIREYTECNSRAPRHPLHNARERPLRRGQLGLRLSDLEQIGRASCRERV